MRKHELTYSYFRIDPNPLTGYRVHLTSKKNNINLCLINVYFSAGSDNDIIDGQNVQFKTDQIDNLFNRIPNSTRKTKPVYILAGDFNFVEVKEDRMQFRAPPCLSTATPSVWTSKHDGYCESFNKLVDTMKLKEAQNDIPTRRGRRQDTITLSKLDRIYISDSNSIFASKECRFRTPFWDFEISDHRPISFTILTRTNKNKKPAIKSWVPDAPLFRDCIDHFYQQETEGCQNVWERWDAFERALYKTQNYLYKQKNAQKSS